MVHGSSGVWWASLNQKLDTSVKVSVESLLKNLTVM